MGLFDKLKKKQAAQQEAQASNSSEESLSDVAESTDKPADEFESIQADIDSVSLDDGEEKESSAPEETKEAAPRKKFEFKFNKKTMLIAGAVSGVILACAGGIGTYLMLQARIYPKVEQATHLFFKTMGGQNALAAAYDFFDPAMKKNFTMENFQLWVRTSQFLFEKIEKVEFSPSGYKEENRKGDLSGKILYTDKSTGTFDLSFIVTKSDSGDKIQWTGLRVESEARRQLYYASAYQMVQGFLDTLKKEKFEQFENFIHAGSREKIGRVKLSQLHHKLSELGFTELKFEEDKRTAKSNVEVVFEGLGKTKIGTRYRGQVTVFYDKGNWMVVGVNFKSVS